MEAKKKNITIHKQDPEMRSERYYTATIRLLEDNTCAVNISGLRWQVDEAILSEVFSAVPEGTKQVNFQHFYHTKLPNTAILNSLSLLPTSVERFKSTGGSLIKYKEDNKIYKFSPLLGFSTLKKIELQPRSEQEIKWMVGKLYWELGILYTESPRLGLKQEKYDAVADIKGYAQQIVKDFATAAHLCSAAESQDFNMVLSIVANTLYTGGNGNLAKTIVDHAINPSESLRSQTAAQRLRFFTQSLETGRYAESDAPEEAASKTLQA